jgi:predicted RNA-binding Zn-ribbon protein involved in translation (DUF1610 family)
MGRKQKLRIQKKCTSCGRNISSWNKSGLCNRHYHYEHNKKMVRKKIEEHRCLDCGKSTDHDVFVRCKECRNKQKQSYHKRKEKERFPSTKEEGGKL